MGTHVIKMPDIGEGIAEVELVEWHVQVGDSVNEDQVLAEVMTDKATVEIPSPVAGRILALGGQPGQVMAVGGELILLDVEGGPPPHRPAGSMSQRSCDGGAGQPASRARGHTGHVATGRTSPATRPIRPPHRPRCGGGGPGGRRTPHHATPPTHPPPRHPPPRDSARPRPTRAHRHPRPRAHEPARRRVAAPAGATARSSARRSAGRRLRTRRTRPPAPK